MALTFEPCFSKLLPINILNGTKEFLPSALYTLAD